MKKIATFALAALSFYSLNLCATEEGEEIYPDEETVAITAENAPIEGEEGYSLRFDKQGRNTAGEVTESTL